MYSTNLPPVAFHTGQSDFSTSCMLKRGALFVSAGAGEGGRGAEDEHPLPALGHPVSPALFFFFFQALGLSLTKLGDVRTQPPPVASRLLRTTPGEPAVRPRFR